MAGDDDLVFAFFVLDVDHRWRHEGIHLSREEGVGLVEKFKRDRRCLGMVALELPTGRKIYEWAPEQEGREGRGDHDE
jgi:hypothetical protein